MGWYNSSWEARVEITIDNTHVDSDLTDFPMVIDERSLPALFWTEVKSDGSDIVVTSADGTTKLDRDLAEWDRTNEVMTLRVRIPTLSSSSNTILYLYYDNPSASETDTTDTYRTEIETYYPFGEDPSGTPPQILDRSVNGVDMTSYGSMASGDLIDAKISKGLDFDGTDDYISATDPLGWTFGDGSSDEAFSVSFWFYAVTSAVGGVIGKVVDATGGEWYVLWANSKIYFRLLDDSSSGYIGAVTDSTVSTGTWHKCTCTYDGGGSSSGAKIYLDGSIRATSASASGSYTAMENTGEAARIGARESFFFEGYLDEFILFREELSVAYINASNRNEQTDTYTFYTVGGIVTPDIVITAPDASALGSSSVNNLLTESEWYNSDWGNRVKVTVNYSDIEINLTDYTMLLDERDLPATFWTNVRSDGYDVLVTTGDGVTVIPKDTSEWDSTAETFVTRVKVPYLSATSNTSLYIYYGKATASSDLSTENAYGSDAVSHLALNGDPTDSVPQQIDRITSSGVDLQVWNLTADDLIDGQVGKGLNFDTGDYLYGDDTDAWSFGNGLVDTPFSVSIWFNTDLVTSDSRYIINKTDDKTHGEWYAQNYEDDIYFRCVDDSTLGYIGRVALAAVTASTWYKLDFTYDGSGLDTGLKIYRDGVELSTSSTSDGTYVAMENTTDKPRIGAAGAGAFPYNGQLDDAFVHSSVLSEVQIKTAYLNEKTSSTFYAVGSEESNIVGTIVTTTPASAIGGIIAPTTLYGSLTLTPGDSDAIGDTLAPTTLYGSLTVSRTVSAIGDTLDPSVVEGGGLIISGVLAEAIGDVIASDVLYGSLTASGTASAVGDTLSPTTLLGSLALSATVSAVGDTVNPVVDAGGDISVSATVSAIGDTIDPEVLLASMILTTTQADAIGNTLDPTVLVGGLTLTRIASAIGDVNAPAVLLGAVTVVSTVSAVGDTIDPEVLLASMAILTAQVDAVGGSVDPTVICGALLISVTASAVGDTVDPTTTVVGGATIVNAMASAVGDTTGPTITTVSLGTELDNVARWIFSSVAAHFAPVASSIPLLYHVEGVDERGDEVSRNDSVELRLTGPNIKEVNGRYHSSTEINVLLTNYMKMLEDTYSLVDWTGKFQAEMMERIPIYKLGSGTFDDGSLLGCLLPDSKRGVKAFYFGQIDKVDRIRQSEVDGLYTMELAV